LRKKINESLQLKKILTNAQHNQINLINELTEIFSRVDVKIKETVALFVAENL